MNKPINPTQPTVAAASYDTWFRTKVQQAIDSKEPRIEHDALVAEMDVLIAAIEADATM